MQNFTLNVPNCPHNEKSPYLIVKTAKTIFDDFTIVNACVLQN